MADINYFQQLPGGHCFKCHKDFTEWGDEHHKNCHGEPTRCGEACKDSKFKLEEAQKWLPK